MKVNRKHFHSINVQIICDANMLLTNVVARWPGSTHDAFIWRNSSVGRRLEARAVRDGWLINNAWPRIINSWPRIINTWPRIHIFLTNVTRGAP